MANPEDFTRLSTTHLEQMKVAAQQRRERMESLGQKPPATRAKYAKATRLAFPPGVEPPTHIPPFPPNLLTALPGDESPLTALPGDEDASSKSLLSKLLSMLAESGKKRKKGDAGGSLEGVGSKALQIEQAISGDPIAIAGLSIDVYKRRMGEVKAAGSEFEAAMSPKSERIGQVGGHLFGGAEHMFASANPLSEFGIKSTPEVMAHLGKVTAEAIDKLQTWSKELHEANIKFAEFSGTMTRVQVQQEIQEMYLSRERGERRAASASFLAEGRMELERTTAPIEDLWANIKGDVIGIFDRLAATWLKPLSRIAETVNDIHNAIMGKDKGEEELTKWLKDITELDGRPIRFRN